MHAHVQREFIGGSMLY